LLSVAGMKQVDDLKGTFIVTNNSYWIGVPPRKIHSWETSMQASRWLRDCSLV